MTRIVFAAATALLLAASAPALASGSATEQSPYASMAMYLITPHEARPATDDQKLEAKVEVTRRQKLAEWTGAHSREVYPGYGLSNVHGPAAR